MEIPTLLNPIQGPKYLRLARHKKPQDETWILERQATKGSNAFYLFKDSKISPGCDQTIINKSFLPAYSETWP